MSSGRRHALPALAAGLIAMGFAAVCTAFVWQSTLTSFADDSVSYLVMARVFSPWQAASAPLAEAFAREAVYPPLFPALLAATGAAHDLALAHALNALVMSACLVLLYFLGADWLGSRWAAAGVVAVSALLPALWIHVKAILSEPLFCLVLLGALRALDRAGDGRARGGTLAILMTALVMTRAAGLAVIAGYAAWVLTRRQMPLPRRMGALLPALVAGAAFAGWMLLRPAEGGGYGATLLDRFQHFHGAASPLTAWGESLLRQAVAMAEAWAGALLLFWVEGQPLRVALAGAVGTLALAGMALRLAAGKPDAWMIAAYLAQLLSWPFYDQMTRFLFPVVPVLVLYAFAAAGAGLKRLGRPPALSHAVVALLVASLAAPAAGFLHQRAKSGARHAGIIDWYRTPDLEQARLRAQVHLDLMDDMERIRALTREGDRVMWVAPAYIALLAERHGVPAPPPNLPPADYRQAVREARPDYVFLSAYHPRDTLSDAAWRTGTAAMRDDAQVVHARRRADGTLSSLLVRPLDFPVLARGETAR